MWLSEHDTMKQIKILNNLNSVYILINLGLIVLSTHCAGDIGMSESVDGGKQCKLIDKNHQATTNFPQESDPRPETWKASLTPTVLCVLLMTKYGHLNH